MKEGWTYKKIKDIGSVIGGTTPNTSVKEYWDGSLCWISPAELDGGHYLYDSRKKITEAAVKAKSLKLLPEGTVILSSRAPIGKVVINKVPTYCNQGFKCVVCGEKIYNEFLYWWFWGKTDYLNSLGTGATFREISKKVVEEITIPVPPLSEQQSIVDYLDSVFAKIDAMKANAEKALNEAKALFQASLKEMLEPKEGWKEKKLKEVVASITDGDHQPPPKSDDGIPFITISNIDKNSNKIVFGETFYVPKSYYCALKKERIPQQGDVLYTVTGSFGIPVLIDFQKDFCFQRHIALIRPKMGVLSPTYLFYWILSSYATSQAENTATGAAQRTVSLNSLRNFTIHVPPIHEQQSIVATLDSLKSKVDCFKANYEKISQECDALKQAILRQVFE